MTEQRDVIAIGAGFSGLYMLHRARDLLGLDAELMEAGDARPTSWAPMLRPTCMPAHSRVNSSTTLRTRNARPSQVLAVKKSQDHT